jgi:hypothetical protein
MTEHTNGEKLVAVRRELQLRNRLYPRWVEDQRIMAADAEWQISVFEAIVRDYERLYEADEIKAKGERLPGI